MSEAPEWLRNWQQNPAKFDNPPHTAWKPGQSGYPAGRPPGIVDKRARLTKMLGDDAEHVVKKAVELAKDGDVQAIGLILARVAAPLKPTDEPAPFDLDTTASLEAQGLAVLKAIAEGVLTPHQGKSLLELVHGLAALRDVDTLARRLDALEEEMRAGRPGVAPGNVQEQS
jgi:Family of unknown function (DUF5681)